MSKTPPKSQFVVYQAENGALKIDVRFEGETVWLTQPLIAELFQTTVPNISMHLRNIYEEGELASGATLKQFLTVRQEGARHVSRNLEYYNLDAIISVGYRVKSRGATQFRIWATQRLREYEEPQGSADRQTPGEEEAGSEMIAGPSTPLGPGLKPYPAMKDSGVPWLGEVPEHWQVRKLRDVLERVTERNRTDLPLLSVVREKGVIQRDTTSKDENHNFIPDDLSNYKVVRTGQFAMNKMKAWQGSYGVSRHDGIVSPAYFVFDVSDVDGEFFHTAIRSTTYVPFFTQASDGVRIGQWDLAEARMKEIPFCVPPLPEQAAIVRFLGHADRRMRRYIRAKQKLIKLLGEQKQAIIHQAVTRGLDPDVRLKPSGVEWLGGVPAHWEVQRLKTLIASVTSGSRGWSNFAADDGPLLIRIGNLTRASIGLDLTDVVRLNLPKAAAAEAGRTQVHSGDVLLSITAYIGSVAIVPENIGEAFISQHIACCRPGPGAANVKWLAYVLLSPVGQVHGKLCMYGGTKQGLSLDDVKNYIVLLPPDAEQDALVLWIENAAKSVDGAMHSASREVSLVREYRTRLIADVVTGKLDVRDAAVQLPDDDDADGDGTGGFQTRPDGDSADNTEMTDAYNLRADDPDAVPGEFEA